MLANARRIRQARQPSTPDSQEDALSCVVLGLQVSQTYFPQAIEKEHIHEEQTGIFSLECNAQVAGVLGGR